MPRWKEKGREENNEEEEKELSKEQGRGRKKVGNQNLNKYLTKVGHPLSPPSPPHLGAPPSLPPPDEQTTKKKLVRRLDWGERNTFFQKREI